MFNSEIRFRQLIIKDQRTNGPVNAHLISWPTLVKNKHIKPEKYMVKK